MFRLTLTMMPCDHCDKGLEEHKELDEYYIYFNGQTWLCWGCYGDLVVQKIKAQN
jgi:hypothetical protein